MIKTIVNALLYKGEVGISLPRICLEEIIWNLEKVKKKKKIVTVTLFWTASNWKVVKCQWGKLSFERTVMELSLLALSKGVWNTLNTTNAVEWLNEYCISFLYSTTK